MNDEAGAYIWKDGILVPDLEDEAMAARQKLKDKTDINNAEVEVTDVKK
jgi:hypothetical protein